MIVKNSFYFLLPIFYSKVSNPDFQVRICTYKYGFFDHLKKKLEIREKEAKGFERKVREKRVESKRRARKRLKIVKSSPGDLGIKKKKVENERIRANTSLRVGDWRKIS